MRFIAYLIFCEGKIYKCLSKGHGLKRLLIVENR